MNLKLSYLNINSQNLKSLYKLYYSKKLIRGLTASKAPNFKANSTTFVFYGNIIAIDPIKRIECNAIFNKTVNIASVTLSIRPYSSLKSLIRFSNLNKAKIRLKGDGFFQIEISFINNIFDSNAPIFEVQANIFNYLTSQFSKYLNYNSKKKSENFAPSIIYISSDIIEQNTTSFVRYSSICSWMNDNQFSTNPRGLNFEIIHIITYNQNKLIAVVLYNQSQKFSIHVKSLAW